MAVRDADPADRALIRRARITSDPGPLLDHLADTGPVMTRARRLLIHSALTLALVEDGLAGQARAALTLLDRAAIPDDSVQRPTPPLRRQARARRRCLISRVERVEDDWRG
ncbi:hypothetical protein HKCCSP123_19790 [Rhodobacterales bacterium HKCCSP123]|nr:hypothetical protein [Rhodobacterales bacterium HKCCSP123]